jgi:multiple sugar transport system ATP-binding protein
VEGSIEYMASNMSDVEETAPAGSTIKIEGLRKTFDSGSVVACEDINLELDDEFVVLLGPSGCGKTTTLRCIAGLEQPDEGHIFLGGEEVTYARPKDRNLAFVFQSIALFPHMSVRDNMRFGLDMMTDLNAEKKRERVEEAAEILGIDDLLDRSPSALSGGQQQRVSLGRAMVLEPSGFLLDEPFSALDANLRDQMRVEMKKLHRRLETAMIFVTHDQEEAMTLGDKIVVMNQGHIQQIGSPYEIYNEPVNRFVAEFIGSPSTNFLRATIQDRGESIELVNSTFSLTLTDAQATNLRSFVGDSIWIGIRPEDIEVTTGNTGLFETEIQVIEPLGANDAVYMSLSIDGESNELIALTDQGAFEETATVAIDIDPSAIWLFDDTGDQIL